jgi:dihydroflavonol-4-reductase
MTGGVANGSLVTVEVMPISTAPVLVTGATGYVAAEIVRQLLERGYRVRGTTRDLAGAQASGDLGSLPGADQALELVAADLMAEESLEGAASGCEYVMHVASPYALNVADPQRDLVDPAVQGTLSLLRASASAGSVKRVVLTSSFAAIGGFAREEPYTENDWNEVASLSNNAYSYSKVLAERAAWGFIEDEKPGFDLVVMNPTTVFGPTVVARLNQSHEFFSGMTDGSQPAIVAVDHPAVDVRDVALAHILAMEEPEASGRYLLAAGNFTPRQIADVGIRLGIDRRFGLPRLRLDRGLGVMLSRAAIPFQPRGTQAFLRGSLGKTWVVDGSRAQRELGLRYQDLDQTIADTWISLEGHGLLGKRR